MITRPFLRPTLQPLLHGTIALAMAAVLPLRATPVGAQDYTHPRDMDLPAPSFQRPDAEGHFSSVTLLLYLISPNFP